MSRREEEMMLEMPGTSREGVPKRIIVDANNPNVEIISAKKPQVPQEVTKKAAVILFIANSHYKVLMTIMGAAADESDLSLGDQIHNILFTAYTILRQKFNATGGTLEQRTAATGFKVSYRGQNYEIERKPILELVLAEAIACGVPFAKYDQRDPNNWYGIANPLFNFLCGSALRRKELRLGHHHMPIHKRDGIEKDVALSQYGIYGAHHPLCEGVSFPPEKRTSMAQSVGPITALLCYIKTERTYAKKWEDAVKRAFAHFPDIDVILHLLKEKEPAEIRTLITLICDVALIVTTRQATRMFPPPAAFSYLMRHGGRVGNTEYRADILRTNFNFSGHGAFVFYKLFSHLKWNIALNNATDNIAKQIVYHSMFGTYKEDLGILSQITNQAKWDTRENMGAVFRQVNTQGNVITFEPIKQIYYSKLSQANQTGLLTTSYNQVASVPCFSGKTKRTYSDAFFDHLSKEKTRAAGGRSLQELVTSYAALRESLRTHLESKGRVLSVGTTGWRRVAELAPQHEPEEDLNIEFQTSGKYFLGKE